MYNSPVAIADNELQLIEDNLVNAAFSGQTNIEDICCSCPTPYTVGVIGVIPVKGVILSSCSPEEIELDCIGCDLIREWVDEGLNDTSIKGIIYDVDSPGGSIAVQPLADYIQANRSIKPQIVYCSRQIASAAYWLFASLPIVLTPSSQAGSIDALLTLNDTSKAFEEMGVTVYQFKSSPFKGQGNDGVPLTKDFREEMLRRAILIGSRFRNFVLQNRQITDIETAFNGLTHFDQEAVKLGLADSLVSNIDELVSTFT